MKKTLAVVLALTCLLSLCACGETSGSATKPSAIFKDSPVYGMISEDGTAFATTFKGDVLVFKGDASSLVLSPDRTKAVLLETDGRLLAYSSLPDTESHSTISENAAYIYSVRDAGVLYQDADDIWHRYTFSDGETLKVGECDAITCSNEFNIAYASEGKIYLLNADEAEAEALASYEKDKSVSINVISKDGETAVWSIADGSSQEMYIYENGEKSKIGSLESSSSYNRVIASFNESGTLLLAYSPWSKTMYVKPEEKDSIKVKLSGEPESVLYTASGSFFLDESASFSGGYILVEGNSDSTLLYINAEGEREKVLSEIKDVAIYNGQLVYIDSENNLFYAKLKGASIGDPVKLSGDVSYLRLSLTGGYAYYLKNIEKNEGTLYVYKLGDKEPQKVSNDVYTSITTSTDGKTVFYFKEYEKVEDPSSWLSKYEGTLYSFSFGAKESKKIAAEVMIDSLDSGLNRNGVKENSFMYEKYVSMNSADNGILVNWVYYDGTTSTVIAKEVKAG